LFKQFQHHNRNQQLAYIKRIKINIFYYYTYDATHSFHLYRRSDLIWIHLLLVIFASFSSPWDIIFLSKHKIYLRTSHVISCFGIQRGISHFTATFTCLVCRIEHITQSLWNTNTDIGNYNFICKNRPNIPRYSSLVSHRY